MKTIFHITLTILTLAFLCQCNSTINNSQTKQDKNIIKELTIDLNADNYVDTITLLEPDTSGDPGVFKKIQISGKNITPFELQANYAWDTIPQYLRKNNDKENNCDFLFIKRDNKSSYIILTGWQYSSGQEDFALIGISNGKCTLLTKENFNDIGELDDLNKDGNLEIVLNPTWSEGISYIDSINASITSYAPYYVYSLTPSTFTFDSVLTRKYNENNYVWAGLDNVGDVEVIWYRNDNKYKIWTK